MSIVVPILVILALLPTFVLGLKSRNLNDVDTIPIKFLIGVVSWNGLVALSIVIPIFLDGWSAIMNAVYDDGVSRAMGVVLIITGRVFVSGMTWVIALVLAVYAGHIMRRIDDRRKCIND